LRTRGTEEKVRLPEEELLGAGSLGVPEISLDGRPHVFGQKRR
jgi:hypothetical protein